MGVPPERILLDPTPDFGKNTRHSLMVLKHIRDFADHGMPVLLAISRKDFIGESVDAGPPETCACPPPSPPRPTRWSMGSP